MPHPAGSGHLPESAGMATLRKSVRPEPSRLLVVGPVSTTMMTAEPMVARGAHYTALLDTTDHQGAAKLLAREREQLLEAADTLLFGEPDSERTVRWAEVLIEDLETGERWSVETCDQLREHLSGCAALTGGS